MEKIYDHANTLLAIILRPNQIREEKFFATENSQEMQVAFFNLKKDTVIDNHIHLKQNRNIHSTSEVSVVLKGEIEVSIFDNDKNLVCKHKLISGETVALFEGGHGIKIIEDATLVESKQGPYLEEIDKVRF